MDESPLSTLQKSLRLNLDTTVYGTFAEIGAGQEVARWFFLAGRAAGTVAKTMSAYDMTISDAIYGKSDRYVSRMRLEAMLTHEYALLVERLRETRGATTKFFVFADTAATRRQGTTEDGHGWLGIRFQDVPGVEPSEVMVHMLLRDAERVREQDALGIVGVNLIYAATFHRDDADVFLRSLRDNVFPDRVEIDMIRFTGPAFTKIDNRVMALRLVRHGLTEATMFTPEGEVVQPAEVLFKKPLVIARGRFRPATLATVDLIERTVTQFSVEPELNGEVPVVVAELTVRDLRSQPAAGTGATTESDIDEADFLARVDVLHTLGYLVLISNHARYFRLVEHLLRYTQQPIAIALGIAAICAIMDEEHYGDLPGSSLEAVGRLFARNVRVYVAASRDRATGAILTAANLPVAPNLRHLYAHLLEHRNVVGLQAYTEACIGIDPDEVLGWIRSGNPAWEASVPAAASSVIKAGRLFGLRSP
ncbi:MAG: TonB-dependent receptor [Phycisphaerae bacterium]|nr:TonB-dependent receptor [Phycisphaerae bacterium]